MNITQKAKREILALNNGRDFNDHIRQLYREERTNIDFSVMCCIRRKQIKLIGHNSVEGFNLLKAGYKVIVIISSDGDTIDTQYVDDNHFEAFKNYITTGDFSE